jgi:hypothetical protein
MILCGQAKHTMSSITSNSTVKADYRIQENQQETLDNLTV